MEHTTTNVRFPVKMYEQMRQVAFTQRISMSEFIRQSVKSTLDKLVKEEFDAE